MCLLFFSCKEKNSSQLDEPILNLTFYYENGKDTVVYGEKTNLAIKIENNVFDSLSLVLGNIKNGELLDTLGIIPIKKNVAFFIFQPQKLGLNIIQGVVREYQVEEDRTVIKTTPFETSYYCIMPPTRSNL